MVVPSIMLPGAAPEVYLGVLGPTTNGNPANHVFAVEFDTVLDLEMNEPTATTSASTSTASSPTCRSLSRTTPAMGMPAETPRQCP